MPETHPDLHIIRLPGKARKEVDFLKDALLSYNARNLPEKLLHNVSLHLVLRDEQHNIYGGVVADVAWEALQIFVIWVHEDRRGEGHGKRLLEMAEAEARKEGCRLVILETTTFHASEFYFAQGYEQVGKIAGFPEGHDLYYLKKDL